MCESKMKNPPSQIKDHSSMSVYTLPYMFNATNKPLKCYKFAVLNHMYIKNGKFSGQ